MGKAETKFANTAKRMDDALVDLLETTAFGDITVTSLCNKAKVNRSTFYAHYTDISDLLAEVQIRTINGFSTSSEHHLDISQDSLHRKYLIAYMYFFREKQSSLFVFSKKIRIASFNCNCIRFERLSLTQYGWQKKTLFKERRLQVAI